MTLDIAIIILTILFVGALIFNSVQNIKDGLAELNGVPAIKKDSCPPHKWVYNHMGQMVCNKCSHLIKEE